MDVRKEVNFCRKVGLPIIGVIENMSGFICPNCKNMTEIFLPTTGGGRNMAKEMNLRFLGGIPLDPRIARSCDDGKFFLTEFPDSLATAAFNSIFKAIIDAIQDSPHVDSST